MRDLVVSLLGPLNMLLGYLAPLALVLYGVWLGLKAHVLWGLFLLVASPGLAVVGLTEILFGFDWMSPLWPFTVAGLLFVGMWALTLLAARILSSEDE